MDIIDNFDTEIKKILLEITEDKKKDIISYEIKEKVDQSFFENWFFPCKSQFYYENGTNACTPIALAFIRNMFKLHDLKKIDWENNIMKRGCAIWDSWYDTQKTKNKERHVTPKILLDSFKKDDILDYRDNEVDMISSLNQKIINERKKEGFGENNMIKDLHEELKKAQEGPKKKGFVIIIRDISFSIFVSHERFVLFDSHGIKNLIFPQLACYKEFKNLDYLMKSLVFFYSRKREEENQITISIIRNNK